VRALDSPMSDPLVAMAADEGAKAIDEFVGHAGRLATVIASNFPPQTLADVAAQMAKLAESKKATNEKVAAMGVLVREEAAVAVALFRQAEMWLYLKAPAVSDGNNFGVDVQNYVLGELKAMRTAMEAMVIGSRDYHWGRAEGLAKLLGSDSKDDSTSTSENTDIDGDNKKTVKTSTSKSSKVSSSTPAGFPDYKEYVVALDVKQYHAAFSQLTDMKNYYLRAHVLFAKNMKRLSDPRGEGEDGRSSNSMSMF